jgi:hypothetical protein
MLKWMEEDPHIPPALKEDFSRRLETELADSAKRSKPVWDLMGDAYQSGNKATGGAYASAGRRITTAADWAEAGPVTRLSKLIDADAVYRWYLKPSSPVRAIYPNPEDFVVAVERGHFDLRTLDLVHDLDSAALVSGKMGVSWWNPAHLTDGQTVDEMASALNIPDNFRKGSLRITITVSDATGAGIRKPTALHGLQSQEWRPADPAAAWGRTRSGMPEAVIDPIPLGTPHVEAVPAGQTHMPLIGAGPTPRPVGSPTGPGTP